MHSWPSRLLVLDYLLASCLLSGWQPRLSQSLQDLTLRRLTVGECVNTLHSRTPFCVKASQWQPIGKETVRAFSALSRKTVGKKSGGKKQHHVESNCCSCSPNCLISRLGWKTGEKQQKACFLFIEAVVYTLMSYFHSQQGKWSSRTIYEPPVSTP